MSATYREAASAAQKLGAFIELLGRAQVVLDAAGRAEQDEQNAKDRLTAANEQATKAEALTAESLEQLKVAQDNVLATKAEAQALALQAQADADQILAKAREEAAQIMAVAQSKLEIARREGENVAQQRREVQADLDAAHTELADVRSKIEDAKAEARARFG